MPKIIKKRILKKTHTEEEELKETVEDIREKLKERQRTLVYAIGIFFIAAISIVAFTVYQKTSSTKALELEFEAYKLFHGDNQTSFISPSERYQKALDLFKKSYETKKRPNTLLYMANCNYELGNYDEAIKNLNNLVNKFSDPKMVSLSYYKMALAYSKKGDIDNALASFEKNLNIKNGTLQDIALLEAGKLLELAGKHEDAKSKYRELINKFTKSELLNEAKMRLGE